MQMKSCWSILKIALIFVSIRYILFFLISLKPLDIQVMKALHSKVNIVPIIAKADTLTKAEAKKLKTRILKEIEDNKIQTYHFPEVDEEEDDEDFIKINKELKVS